MMFEKCTPFSVGRVEQVGVGHGLEMSVSLAVLGTEQKEKRPSVWLLYGIGASDPVTFITVSFMLLVVAVVACYIPTRRGMRVDLMVALRYE